MKWIHNTVADAISRLEFSPSTINPIKENNIMFNGMAQMLSNNSYESKNTLSMESIFATNKWMDDEIFPPSIADIACEQKAD